MGKGTNGGGGDGDGEGCGVAWRGGEGRRGYLCAAAAGWRIGADAGVLQDEAGLSRWRDKIMVERDREMEREHEGGSEGERGRERESQREGRRERERDLK